MEDVFGMLGQAILAAIGAAGIIGITMWLLFGAGGEAGPLGEYILKAVERAIGA